MKEEICEANGYTPFENAVQDAIKDLVPPELAKPISTRVGGLYRAAQSCNQMRGELYADIVPKLEQAQRFALEGNGQAANLAIAEVLASYLKWCLEPATAQNSRGDLDTLKHEIVRKAAQEDKAAGAPDGNTSLTIFNAGIRYAVDHLATLGRITKEGAE